MDHLASIEHSMMFVCKFELKEKKENEKDQIAT
jgi:hypothetical protein